MLPSLHLFSNTSGVKVICVCLFVIPPPTYQWSLNRAPTTLSQFAPDFQPFSFRVHFPTNILSHLNTDWTTVALAQLPLVALLVSKRRRNDVLL